MKNLFLILFAFCFLSQALAAPKVSNQEKINDFIRKLESESNQVQGGAVAILRHGKVIYKKTFGYQQAKNTPITADTLFPLASVSKAVSATAIALLVEDGTLSLDEKIKLQHVVNPFSIKNVLSHTTGYKFSGNNEIEVGYNRAKLLKTLQTKIPTCPPGACYYYSNTLYSLIEEALNTKKLSLEFAINKLRTMLKTKGIQLEPISPGVPVAYPHVARKAKNNLYFKSLTMPKYYPKIVPAAAGVYASLNGMIEVYKLSFGYRQDLLSQKTLDIFHAAVSPNYDLSRWMVNWPFHKKFLKSSYGLGWRIIENSKQPQRRLVFHSGHISGVRSFIGFMPSEDVGIIFLTNQDSSYSVKKGFEFWSMLL